MIELFELFALLVACHFVADFPLQGDAIGVGKNRNHDPKLYGVNWYYWLTAHAATQGLLIGIATHSVWFGLFEAITHWIIDFGKCEKWYNLHVDQALHIFVKVVIVILFFAFNLT